MFGLVALAALTWSHQIDGTPKETPVLPQFYQPATLGPSLSEVTMRVMVTGNGKISIPAPSDYSGQLVVSLQVQCEPASAMRFWRLEKRADGLNSVISADMAPGTLAVSVSYKALVLCPGEAVYRTQVSAFKPWLAATALVQSGDPAIKALGVKLKQGTKDDDGFVRNVVLWVARNKTGAKSTSSSALGALSGGGTSAGRANLCAAILRSAGTAARTVSYMPTWATDRIQEQWLTQYWTDEGNWETVDPTVGLLHPARNSMIVLSISSPADENRSSARSLAVYSSEGVPYLSVPELEPGLNLSIDLSTDPFLHSINLIKRFPHQFGGRLMTAGHRRAIKVIAAAEQGRSMTLDESAVLQSIAKNPGNLAFLFDRN